MAVIIRERLEAVADVKLDVGAHQPPDGDTPCGFCIMEKFAWITGQDWSDHPDNCSPVISAFLRRWNDVTDQDGRDQLDAWTIENADRLAATANDGQDMRRGYLVADWAVRTAMPVWLDVAGATNAAEQVRALAPIVDHDSARAARKVTAPLRDQVWDRYWGWRGEIREKVREAVEKALAEKKDAAGAAVAAVAAEAAEAAGAAVAAGAAGAAYGPVYRRVREAIKGKLRPIIDEKLGEQAAPLKASAWELLDQLVALEA